MVTFRSRHGRDGKAMLIDGFEVLKEGRVVGFIYPCGSFYRWESDGHDVNTVLTEEELDAIAQKGVEVRRMPSEYGWLGVGEPCESPPS